MIYCVEDERNIRELLVYTLGTTGFEARGLSDGKELKKALKEEVPELILLDIMLPGEDGYRILEKLKQSPETSEIPIIMVTAKEAEYDKVRGLDGGADDYITKPFGMMEFIARVKAVLRRTKKHSQKQEYRFKGLKVHVERHQVFDNERAVELTLKEFELLSYFLENQGIALSREKILNSVWNYDYFGDARTIDTHVKKLRSKLGEKGEYIKTIWGMGYKFEVN